MTRSVKIIYLYENKYKYNSSTFTCNALLFFALFYFGISISIQVVSRVCELMEIPSLEAGGIGPRMTTALKDLQYIIREINMFIEVWGT